MPRRVASTHALATSLPRIASGLPTPAQQERAFRLRHKATPPFAWELHLQGAENGRDLILALPRGLPWAEGEARDAAPTSPDDPQRAPVWDEGKYRTLSSTRSEVVLQLEGARVRGRYALATTGARASLRRVDPASLRPFPDRILPMLAQAAPYPANEEEYAFELKWDGYRAIAYLEGGRLTLRSRNQINITAQFPELGELAGALGGRQAVLDGEIVALDDTGKPSFQLLQNRLGVTDKGRAKKRSEDVPVAYIVFDVLYLDGHDMMSLPYEERRRALEALPLRGDCWRVSPMHLGDGHAFLDMPGWEGIVAKRLTSTYEPGARSRSWLKIKTQKRQELVIAGWTPGKGARAGRIGALVLGYYEDDAFRYAGKVGTGFTQAMLDSLQKMLAPTARKTSPFGERIAELKDATFVEPQYVAEFEFTEWTSDGRLRHPSYKGLRNDKDARDVTREEM